MSEKDELAKAGLKLCDEIEKLILEGKTHQALEPVAELSFRTDAVSSGDAELQQATPK